MIYPVDIAWLAALLEGEGSFQVDRHKTPHVALNMTDEDIVERAAVLMGSPVRSRGHEKRWFKPHWKRRYETERTGSAAVGIMLTIYRFMGRRRREQIRRAISVWRERHTCRTSEALRSAVRGHLAENLSVRRIGILTGLSRKTVRTIRDAENAR